MAMRFKAPKNDGTVSWTQHVTRKMLYYGISEALVRRVIRSPARVEEGIAPGTIAVMQPAGYGKKKEVWVMYQSLKRPRVKGQTPTEKVRVISAWRYPGRSPLRGPLPIPEDIIAELSDIA